MKRTALVMEIVPMKGRVLGYLVAADTECTLHNFYDAEWKSRFPDLQVGDEIEIEYTSSPSRGGWSITQLSM